MLLLAALGLVGWAGAARANGVIFPPPQPPAPMPNPLAVERSHVTVSIKNFAVTTHVDQVFYNQYGHRIEGTYLFPLPEDAAISDFAMYVDGQRYSAELLERGEARRIYESIVRRRQDPALLEYVGRNLFRASIFPIEARSEKRVELEYSQAIRPEAGVCQYVYPMKVDKFFDGEEPPRIMPARDRREPLYREYPGLYGEVAVTVEIDSEVPIKAVYSPSHDVEVRPKGDHFVKASFEAKNLRPERDFVLYYTLSEKDFGVNLLANRRYGEEEGYFMLLIAPKHEIREEEVAAKEIVFVFDTSGSMSGEKIEQARDALKFCLDNLNPRDRFNVLTFSTDVDLFEPGLVEATRENVRAAREFVEDIKARGGTAINDALLKALGLFDRSERPQMVVFLTDGLPTVGETDVKRIIENVGKENKQDVRVFVFGVGDDVNTHLLDQLSLENRGLSSYVRPAQDIEVEVSSFYSKVSHPVLSDLDLAFEGIEVDDLYPRHLPDLFQGSQVTVFGRYQGDGAARVVLKGELEGKTEAFEYRLEFPRRERGNSFIPRLWATRKVGYLLEQIRLNGEDRELREEVTQLALRYGIVTPYTSFLVEEPRPGRGGEEVARLPAADIPLLSTLGRFARRDGRDGAGGFGGAAGGGGGMAGAGAMPGMAPSVQEAFMGATGEVAVDVSADMQKMKESQVNRWADTGGARYAGDKVFYLRDGVWVDSAFPEKTEGQKLLEVKYNSDAYWSLLSQVPELGPYFALGEKVWVSLEGVLLKVGETGKEKLTEAEWGVLGE